MVEMLNENVNSNLLIGDSKSATQVVSPITVDGLRTPSNPADLRHTPSPASVTAPKKAVETSL